MRWSVWNAGAFNGGRSLCIQISREQSCPLSIYWYPVPLERQLIALQLCHWQFLYNETLQQTFRSLLSKLSKRQQIYVIYPHFEEVRGDVEPWLMARWKARVEFLLSVIELPFSISYGRGTTRQNVSKLAAFRGVVSLSQDFRGKGSSLGNIFQFLQN